jgi:alkaline phosphatase D
MTAWCSGPELVPELVHRHDYANTLSHYEGEIRALRAAAYQAWYEHQPVRAAARPTGAGPRIYRRVRWEVSRG